MSSWSTPRGAEFHARQVRRFLARCPHEQGPARDEDSQVSIHHFTLIVDGPNLQDDALIDAVFEAGCDDAAIGRIDGIHYVEFDREAASLEHAPGDRTMEKQLKIIVEKHPDGYVAYPLGLKGVVVGQGKTYQAALDDVRSAVAFHVQTFGEESITDDSPVIEAFVAEAGVAI